MHFSSSVVVSLQLLENLDTLTRRADELAFGQGSSQASGAHDIEQLIPDFVDFGRDFHDLKTFQDHNYLFVLKIAKKHEKIIGTTSLANLKQKIDEQPFHTHSLEHVMPQWRSLSHLPFLLSFFHHLCFFSLISERSCLRSIF